MDPTWIIRVDQDIDGLEVVVGPSKLVELRAGFGERWPSTT